MTRLPDLFGDAPEPHAEPESAPSWHAVMDGRRQRVGDVVWCAGWPYAVAAFDAAGLPVLEPVEGARRRLPDMLRRLPGGKRGGWKPPLRRYTGKSIKS